MLYECQKFEYMNFLPKNHFVVPPCYFQIKIKNTKMHKDIKQTLLIRRKDSKFSCWVKKKNGKKKTPQATV